MTSEDPLERSVRLLDEALNSPQRFIKLGSPRPRLSTFTKSTIQRLDATNDSLLSGGDGQESGLKRSELLDFSLTLDPGEMTKLCGGASPTVTTLDETTRNIFDNPLGNLLLQFQSTFQSFGSTHNVFDAVSNFIEICSSVVELFSKNRNKIEFQESELLKNERNTWRLIMALYKDRSVKYDDLLDDMSVEYIHERSEKELQEYFYKTNRTVREAQIVVDWLERVASDRRDENGHAEMGHYTDRTVAWENTLHCLQAGGGVAYQPTRPVVRSLDPDAPRRQGKPLHDIDYEDDRRLLHQVFSEIRCGRLDRAEEHCIHCGQEWRAATLEGWRLFYDPNYLPPFSDSKIPIQGNPHRDVWKLCAWRMCNDPRTPAEERAVMGALSGHLPSLLAVAASWEDLLWAELRVLIDIRVEQEVRDNSLRTYVDLPTDYWAGLKSLENIFQSIKSDDRGKEEGNRPDRVIQELIILDNIPELLARCSSWVENNNHIQFLRFLTHMVLTLRALGKSEPMHLGDNVLVAYVKALISERNPEVIAYYTSLLPEEKQIELFSSYMEEVGDSAEKPLILASAEKYDLNIKAITEKVVQNIRSRQERQERELREERDGLTVETTPEDLRKISSLDWMVYYREQRTDTIWECNALIRAFIAEGKLVAARLAHSKIPEDSVSLIVTQYNVEVDEDMYVHWEKFPPKVSSTIKEYLCYKAYLDAQDGFNHWFHQFHNTRPSEPRRPDGGDFTDVITYEHKMEKYKEEVERWKATMDHITKNVKAQLQNILVFPGNGWLMDDYDGDPVRQSHLKKLRAHCIPQVFLLLHKVLLSMDQLDEAMGVFVLLMNKEHKFYEVLTQQGLEDMLNKVEETSFPLLERSKNPFSTRSWPEVIQEERPNSPSSLLKNLPPPRLEKVSELREVAPRDEDRQSCWFDGEEDLANVSSKVTHHFPTSGELFQEGNSDSEIEDLNFDFEDSALSSSRASSHR